MARTFMPTAESFKIENGPQADFGRSPPIFNFESLIFNSQPMPTAESLYDSHVLGNYAKSPLTLVRGLGCRVWDDAGREFLDFSSGIAVTALGHAHPEWARRVHEQALTLVHTSNLWRNPRQAELAARLAELVGLPGRSFFCNSGTEANEALIKLARLHGRKLAGGEEGVRHHVIVFDYAFHGRTFGGMAATPQDKIQNGFRPMLDGFKVAKFNDLDSVKALADDRTAAVLIETIQGEGGVRPATREFLQGLRQLCDERGLLLIIDEVQCGIGRTGKFYAYQHHDVQPDAIGMAKGIGGGFPMGAIWVAEKHASLFTPGSHGCTFGGSPLACAAALATLDLLRDGKLVETVSQRSAAWRAELEKLPAEFPTLVKEIRGAGFMVAIGLHSDPVPVVAALRDQKFLCPSAGHNAIRLLPPLNVTDSDLGESLVRIRAALASLKAN